MDYSHLLPYARRPDFKVARASDLVGSDYRLYRLFEIIPGFLAWSFLFGIIIASIFFSFLTAYFIIAFSVYWVLRNAFLSYHIRYNWRRLLHHLKLNWADMISRFDYKDYYQLIILPYNKEPLAVIEATMRSLEKSIYAKQKLIVVLIAETDADNKAVTRGEKIRDIWQDKFGSFLFVTPPYSPNSEVTHQSASVCHALKEAQTEILDQNHIPYDRVLVSIFDIDTKVYPHYFNCLIWHFFTAKRPYQAAYQPVHLFTGNLWEAPAVSRVVSMTNTFWQMINQERPDKSAAFSSHSVSFKALYEIGYGQSNVVSGDSRIYWNLLIANNGNFNLIPMSYPVKMNATVGRTTLMTIIDIYKQHRLWAYGTENLSYIFYHFIKNKRIPLLQKISVVLVQGGDYLSLATNPLIIFIFGWAPIFLGTEQFHHTVLSYELPTLVRNILLLAIIGVIASAITSLSLVPARPKRQSRFKYTVMALQWILAPIVMITLSSVPSLEAQTRLALGRYMGPQGWGKGQSKNLG